MASGLKNEVVTLQIPEIRKDIPVLSRVAYLNSASCSPPPAPVVSAMADYYTNSPINYRSGRTPFEGEITAQVDAVRERVAASLGADSPREVVFTKNTTEAINVVASGLSWAPGDEVVVTPIEHQSNLIPWIRLEDRAGIRLRYARPEPDGRIDPAALADVVGERTRLVAIHHVSNVLGTIQDVPALAEVAHRAGALLLVDAAQSEGRIPVHVPNLGCDFLTACARKGLMGPQGIGFLWGRFELLAALQPLGIGGQAAQVTTEHAYRLLDPPFAHEAGILNTAGVIGLGAAMEYTDRIGTTAGRSHVVGLTRALVDGLRQQEELDLFSPTDPNLQAGVISWNVRGRDPMTVARALYDRGRVVVAAGTCGSPLATRFVGVDGVLRSSLHHFNDLSDIDRLLETLQAILRDGA